MKKVLTVLSLIALLGIATPAFAAPPPPGPAHGGAHHVRAGYRHDVRPAPHHGHSYYRPNRAGFMIYTGYPRHDSFYYHRLGGYPYCRCPYCMAHSQMNAGFYIRF